MAKLLTCLCCAVFLATTVSAQQPAVRRVVLRRDTVIDGIHCGPTGKAKASFFESGALQECPIASDAELFGHPFPAGTWIKLTTTAQLKSVWLPRNARVQGHTCRGTGYDGWAVTFHPSGALQTCFLAADSVIQDVPCLRGTFWNEVRGGVHVDFYEHGGLQTCAASRGFELGGTAFRKRERVWLDENGAVLITGHR